LYILKWLYDRNILPSRRALIYAQNDSDSDILEWINQLPIDLTVSDGEEDENEDEDEDVNDE